MTNPAIERGLADLIAQRDWLALRSMLARYDAADLAELLDGLEPAERGIAFRLLPRDRSSDVLAELDPGQARALLEGLSDAETRKLLAALAPDDRTYLLEELPGQLTQRLLNLISEEDLAEARLLLGYPEESAGRLMTPEYVAVRPEWTVGEALAHIRQVGRRIETVGVVYVVDPAWKLLDALDLGRFVLADPGTQVSAVMDRIFVSLAATADREEVVATMQRHNLFALPITDSEGTLVGVVTVDDVLEVAEEEATEDFQKAAAIAPLDALYSESSLAVLYRKRVGWLVALVGVNAVSGGVIAAFEDVLAASIALAFFIPLLIGTGGNAGAQAATLMIRALATGDLRLGQWAAAVGKELLVGATLGVTMGVAASWLGIVRGGPDVALVVGLSMVTIVLIANLLGTGLPFILTRLRLDPAVASSPLITTVSDVSGLIVYFAIAWAVLGT